MASSHPTIPVLDLSGTPAQIGAAHGEAQRDRIRTAVDRFLSYMLGGAAVPLTEEAMWSHWAPQVAVNQREAPALVEEMRGIARGAGVPFERIFLLNSLLDLNSFRYLGLAENLVGGCSTFGVVAAADGGRTLLGQTYDMPEFHQESLAVLRLKPSQGPRQLVFTFAGIVGAAGLNEAGIGVNINYLSPRDVGLGRLHSVVVRQALAGSQLADALTPTILPPRAAAPLPHRLRRRHACQRRDDGEAARDLLSRRQRHRSHQSLSLGLAARRRISAAHVDRRLGDALCGLAPVPA